MTKLNVLVIYPGPFGFHVVSYFLCKYGAQKHNFVYLGLAFDATKHCESSQHLPGVTVHSHICKNGLVGRRNLLQLIRDEVEVGDYNVVFTAYIPGISLLKSFFESQKARVIVDIRSGFLVKNPLKRSLLNNLLRYECRKYDFITINSEILGKYLGFVDGEVVELPLGAEPVDMFSRTFNRLHLLYVGSLSKRNIETTVAGLKQYMDRCGGDNVKKYDIVGSGSPEEELAIRKTISESRLDKIVEMHGYVPRENMSVFLKSANVGVSFVPITPYYDRQPVTKTFEFLLAGLPLIATKTTQNKRFIDDSNGILINDTAESFAQGLMEMKSKFYTFDSMTIQKSSQHHSWQNVILSKYIPYIEKIANS